MISTFLRVCRTSHQDDLSVFSNLHRQGGTGSEESERAERKEIGERNEIGERETIDLS